MNRQLPDRLSIVAACLRRLSEPLVSPVMDIELLTQLISGKDNVQFVPDVVLLAVTEFSSENEANHIWERVADNLIGRGEGPSNVWPEVDGIFEELALNAAQHSLSSRGCCATLECYTSAREIVYVIGVADAGIGIPVSLQRNPKYAHISTDEQAILRATEMDVTGTLEPRGAGLCHVMETVRAYLGELVIISGSGFLVVEGGQEPTLANLKELNLPSFDGTFVLATLPIPGS